MSKQILLAFPVLVPRASAAPVNAKTSKSCASNNSAGSTSKMIENQLNAAAKVEIR